MELPLDLNKRATQILLGLLVISLAATGYFFTKYRELQKDPQKNNQKEVRLLVEKLAKIIVLPEGETPTVATVTDPEKLRDQPFFAHAKSGDKVVIYTNARKAILYDPVAGKIMEVAPVNIGGGAAVAPVAPEPEKEQ